MNIMPDGTGWILPPRCAARYTMGVMWKYGVLELSYHNLDPEIEVSRIIMNIRNPYTRLRSWLRLWNTTLREPISAVDYIENLHFANRSKPKFVTIIEDPPNEPWRYPVPLSIYLKELRAFNKSVDYYVRQEHLEADLKAVGYDPRGYVYKSEPVEGVKLESDVRPLSIRVKEPGSVWESGDGQTDLEFYSENPMCAEIVALYYSDDFDNFGYSKDILQMSW